MDDDDVDSNPATEEDNKPVSLPSSYELELNPETTHADGKSSPRKLNIIWVVVIIIVAFCLLCGVIWVVLTSSSNSNFGAVPVATQTPLLTPTPNITSTPTPNMTATQEIIQTATAMIYQATATTVADKWPVLLSDTFDSNKNFWWVNTVDDEFGKITREITGGKYRWDVTAHKGFVAWVPIRPPALTDFYITVEVAQSGAGISDCGIIYRLDPDNNLYYFGINKDQQFLVSRNYKNEWSDLIGWTSSSAILQGQPNRLTVIANGVDFIFFLNDQFAGEVRDDTIKKGRTALAIGLSQPDAQGVFEFDNVEIRIPK